MDLTWLPYVLAGVLVAVVGYFTFGRARSHANRGEGPVDPPR
jgi:hypothetical protein